jgi:glycosidase
MSWSESVIWWHCYPLRFVNAESEYTPQVSHRLGHLANWLDYLIELGANGLLLAPVFASSSHGYDTLDHFRIDPRLGDEADFADLLAQAKRRGIRVCLDGVFNHVSRDHEIVQRALAAGADSPDGQWLRWVGDYPRCFEGHMPLVELNLENPAVQDYVASVMNHWLDLGVDAWRLDAAYAPGPDAWRPIIDKVRAAHPECWILAEVLHGDYADFVTRAGVDSLTQYELWKAIWSSLNDLNLHELAWSLKRHAQFMETFLPHTFIGNHDVTRIATKLTDPRNLRLAIALLLLLPGIPAIYAGDEQGFTGEKLDQAHGDDSVRPPFPADPSDLAPFGRDTLAEYQRVIHQRRMHPWLATATATATNTTNGTTTIVLAGAGHPLTLALNATDQTVQLPGSYGMLTVRGHDWALG